MHGRNNEALSLCRSILENHGLPKTGSLQGANSALDAVLCALRMGISLGRTNSAMVEAIMGQSAKQSERSSNPRIESGR